jgi:predicted alpha/beta-fold hydrolase
MPPDLNLPITPFRPPLWMRPAMVQTALASFKFRKRGTHPMESLAQSMVLECADDVRLSASFTPHLDNHALVILLHGWEGSINSTYVMSCGRQLYEKGCSVFRLNFRDHGDSHHLNEEPFHSARLGEVVDGVVAGASLAGGAPVFIVGFSLGGNFALRVGRGLKDKLVPGLKHIFAVSPVIDPLAASPMVDKSPLIRRYFYKKWTTSLKKKQAAFPHLYDFSGIEDETTVMAMSRKFVPLYTEFDTAEDYFNAYRIWPDDLTDCHVPISLIMSKDDPVIPPGDIHHLKLSPSIHKVMTDYGGHNGFFQSLDGPTWYDDYIHAHIFKQV